MEPSVWSWDKYFELFSQRIENQFKQKFTKNVVISLFN
jgi:hypothetical protein